jgi:hypothetical protein
MSIRLLYQILVGILGLGAFFFGLGLTASFFAYQRPFSDPDIPTGPVGYYFVAFTGCALMGWGGGLIGAARAPEASRTVTTITTWVLVVMAVVRMAAWLVGDYSTWLGDLPRTEASVLLGLALALVWLRPRSGTLAASRSSAPDATDSTVSASAADEPVRTSAAEQKGA